MTPLQLAWSKCVSIEKGILPVVHSICTFPGEALSPVSAPRCDLLPPSCHCQQARHLFFLNKFIYLCIYFWLRWVFVAARGLSLVAVSGGYSSLRCAGFSLWWLLLLQSTGSRHVGFSSCGSWALERRLSSCGSRA